MFEDTVECTNCQLVRRFSGYGYAPLFRPVLQLAIDGKVPASTQNQALSAILFLYKKVLVMELPWVEDIVRAKRPIRVPVVLIRLYASDAAAQASPQGIVTH